MSRVYDLLKAKPDRRIVTIGPEESVLRAITVMAEEQIGSLVVMSGDVIVGIVTERDYARKVVLDNRSSSETPVKDIMRTKIRCVGLPASLDDCRAIMTEDRIRYVPVVENGFLVGLVSIGDVVGQAIREKDFLIKQLTDYITGARPVRLGDGGR